MSTLVAPCAIGAEKVLSNELKQLDFIPQGTLPGRVIFTPSTEEMAQGDKGDLSAMYRANLCLRTADRIYLRMASFSCTDFDTLFDGVRSIPWYDYFRKNTRVVVDKVRTHSSRLSSEHSVQSIVHKAIYESLGQAWHMTVLPETGEEANVRVYIDSDVVSILLDLSGMPLHRRGYRTAGGEAPIRETLAAVLLQLMNWRRKVPLHDAFCGSGTIPIEATLYAHNIAPGLGRSFALEKLTIFDSADGKKIIESERQKAALAIRTDCLVRITGSDIDKKILVSARANAERACSIAGQALQTAGSDARISRPDFTQADYTELAAPYDTGLILSNPPYGERLGDHDSASELYSAMHSLFSSFSGWNLGIITSHDDFEERIGKNATKKRKLKSGNLDTCFYMYME